jgi:membrane protein YqaA with SNARE-associated domain
MNKKRPKFSRVLKRTERKVLIAWIRFAKKHRQSSRLPALLFLLLFMDGFVMVIPSLVCLVAAVTISPSRWLLFGSLATIAATLNNISTYFLGRVLPSGTLEHLVNYVGLSSMWNEAQLSIHKYGPFSSFVGALLGLPTQMITALVGISDARLLKSDLGVSSSLIQMIS